MAGSCTVPPPPAALLHADAAPPEAVTVVAEIRSDAGLPFPSETPVNLDHSPGSDFVGVVLWRSDLSWQDAKEVQDWLREPSEDTGGVTYPTRERALKHLVESLRAEDAPEEPFLHFVGAYLTAGVSHARYTFILGMLRPVAFELYKRAWRAKLDELDKNERTMPWRAKVIRFLQLTAGRPTSQVEVLTPTGAVGELKDPQRYPIIDLLLT